MGGDWRCEKGREGGNQDVIKAVAIVLNWTSPNQGAGKPCIDPGPQGYSCLQGEEDYVLPCHWLRAACPASLLAGPGEKPPGRE